MSNQMGFWHLIMGSSPVVKLVMLLLVAMSVYSWYLITQKRAALRYAKRDADQFESTFWSGTDLHRMYLDLEPKTAEASGLSLIFISGFKEFLRHRNQTGVDPESVVSSTQRAMRAAMAREIELLEMHLSWLATAGSVSPYFGLFGTVWGVMNSFMALGNVKQVSLSQVAPGIAEALIATAMGLFVAIPAVIFYNRYVNQVEKLTTRYDNFVDEFSNILQRQYVYLQTQQRQKP